MLLKYLQNIVLLKILIFIKDNEIDVCSYLNKTELELYNFYIENKENNIIYIIKTLTNVVDCHYQLLSFKFENLELVYGDIYSLDLF